MALVLIVPLPGGVRAPATAAVDPARVAPSMTPSMRIASSARCHAGVKRVHGVKERTFCGPATVTVTVGGHTYKMSQGECDRTGKMFSINIGTVTISGGHHRKPNYFGVLISGVPPLKGHGSYTTKSVMGSFVYNGKTYPLMSGLGSLETKVVLLDGGSHGTVSETATKYKRKPTKELFGSGTTYSLVPSGRKVKLQATFHC